MINNADGSSRYPGISAGDRGFITTLNPIVNGEAFIAFRIVPVRNDAGTAVTGDYAISGATQTTHQYSEYELQAMTRLFFGATPSVMTDLNQFFSIDTTRIPTVINVDDSQDTFDLNKAIASGDTRNITISLQNLIGSHASLFGGDNSVIDFLNPTDSTLDNNLQLLFAIDSTTGGFLNGDATGTNVN